jgi:predicted ABC-type ATPase
VRLVFVGVPTVEDAIERVAARVTKGGHDVRESDIRRRWPIAHTNLAKAGEITLLDPNALPAVTAVLVPLIGLR